MQGTDVSHTHFAVMVSTHVGRSRLSVCMEAVVWQQDSTKAKLPIAQQTVTNVVSTSVAAIIQVEMIFHFKCIDFYLLQ